MFLFFYLGALLPKNLLSFITGWLVRLHLPSALNEWLKVRFVEVFGIDMTEAAHPLTTFRCIEDVFTRALKPGMRPVRGAVCSPADGILSISDSVTDGDRATQVKGLTYSLRDLAFGQGKTSSDFKPSWFFTVYLAPHNYHRVHSPFTGTVTRLRYIPGRLWPVNQYFVHKMKNLFNLNERLVFEIDVDGGGKAWVVMVGAFNVGRMVTPLAPDFVTNSLKRQWGSNTIHEWAPTSGQTLNAGAELGTFMLGSTVVVICDEKLIKRYPLVQSQAKRPILMGESLL